MVRQIVVLANRGEGSLSLLLPSLDFGGYHEHVVDEHTSRWASSFFGLAIMVPLLLAAPVQCPTNQDPRRESVEPPAEAVYRSALNLRELGYVDAEEETLRHLINQYPQSRWAERARLELSERQGSE